MTLIVESGAGSSNSDCYISLVDAATYHTSRGNAGWAAIASDELREQAILKATDYMTQIYRSLWQGFRVTHTQALDWPRTSVLVDVHISISHDVIPVEIQRACAELALKASAGTLYADQTQQVAKEKIGPIETEFDIYSPVAIQYKSIDAMLAPYLRRGRGSVETVRR